MAFVDILIGCVSGAVALAVAVGGVVVDVAAAYVVAADSGVRGGCWCDCC